MFRTTVVQKIKTHISHSINVFFFLDNLAVYEIMWKNIIEPGRSRDNMAHAHFTLDT